MGHCVSVAEVYATETLKKLPRPQRRPRPRPRPPGGAGPAVPRGVVARRGELLNAEAEAKGRPKETKNKLAQSRKNNKNLQMVSKCKKLPDHEVPLFDP